MSFFRESELKKKIKREKMKPCDCLGVLICEHIAQYRFYTFVCVNGKLSGAHLMRFLIKKSCSTD